MTDNNLTPALKRELRNLWYDDPDAKRFGFQVVYRTRETLTAGGYLKEVINESRALLCELDDKGREYIDTLRERIDRRDLDHLDAAERLFLIERLDPKNTDDLNTLKTIIGRALTDRTIDRLKDNEAAAWNIENRLHEYRRAYREFKAIERKLFADPDGENATEQRRKAVTEEEE